jgi:transcriptional regulator GlxA family with amidase domain
MDSRIDAAIRLMHLESHLNFRVRDLAKRFNLSLWHFTHLFKAETSVSPKQYLSRLKIEKAEALLNHSFLSVKEVAANAGFSDRSHFSRDFKKMHGLAPSVFRAHKRTGDATKERAATSATE